MTRARAGATLASIVLTLSAPAAADPGGSAAKLRLVRLLLAQSPALARIPASGNAQAALLLEAARAACADAERLSGAGRDEAAGERLDFALRQVVAASALVPDPAQLAVQAARAQRQLDEALRAFGLLARGAGAITPGQRAEAERIAAQGARAAALAQAGEHAGAAALLAEAGQALAALLATVAAQPVVYGHSFASPADEFSHELARNASFDELVPLALAQLGSSAGAAGLANQYLQQSRALRERATAQAAGGEHAAALQTIQAATGHLQRALRAAGVAVPASPEGP